MHVCMRSLLGRLILKVISNLGFPGGSVGKSPLANAEDIANADPWSRKIPHAAEQLSLCTAMIEPVL